MPEIANLWLEDAEKTEIAGRSLARTLYALPLTITLEGELGSGKTTFMKGFANGLQISDPITSPTFALEQRYQTENHGELLHIDLYRLEKHQAKSLIDDSNDHAGIRCIEWASRLPEAIPKPIIRLEFTDNRTKQGRGLHIHFDDVPLPSSEQIDKWRKEVMLPKNVIDHCDAVANMTDRLSEEMLKNGIIVRPEVARTAAKLHDLLRFFDFRKEASPNDAPKPSTEQTACWNALKMHYTGLNHEEACAEFLRDKGFDTLANIVRPHGLTLPFSRRETTEQLLLYYADKRVKFTEVVTVQERFEDFRNRYCKGESTDFSIQWEQETKRIEALLFPDGAPL